MFKWHLGLTLLFSTLTFQSVQAQSEGFEFSYSSWWAESRSDIYRATIYNHLLGPLSYGFGFQRVVDRERGPRGSLTGGDITVSLGRGSSGLFASGTFGMGMTQGDGNLDANWSAGAGYRRRVLKIFAVGLEASYRAEDRSFRGFWNLDNLDRRGFVLQASVSLNTGGARGRRPGARPSSERPRPYEPPDNDEVVTISRKSGASKEAARLAADVVATAISVMGTPYKWGGEDSNGFDCSGLIKYAYGEHGIIIPRVSRDQARTGKLVERRIASLRPGDILGFSVEKSSQITHVGLYIGEGRFIHSASGGVKISDLTGKEPEGRWWRDRWVITRRILN